MGKSSVKWAQLVSYSKRVSEPKFEFNNQIPIAFSATQSVNSAKYMYIYTCNKSGIQTQVEQVILAKFRREIEQHFLTHP
jgi:hypothetical protein